MTSRTWIGSLVIGFVLVVLCYSQEFKDSKQHHDNHDHGNHDYGNHDHGNHDCTNKYSEGCNIENQDSLASEDDNMFQKGHLKPFGSHRPPDFMVEELYYAISPQDFYMNYVVKHKPVVLKGSVKHWPAYTKWTDEYLNETYGNVSVLMETKDDDKHNIPGSTNFSTFLHTYQHANRYLVDEVLPDMRKDVVLPLELRCEEMSSYFFVSYFWMSNGGTSSKIHIDTDENLLCVIHGHKSVILVSPLYSKDLYTDSAHTLGVADIDPQSVDMVKYPRVKNVRYSLAKVEEGDIVYIPQMWWHQVVSRSERQQAVALWWKSKPFWKEMEKTAIPKTPNPSDSPGSPYSYATTLADYERWVQDVKDRVPRIKCKHQENLMSDYKWETDKIPNAPVTLGDGGIYEEEMINAGVNIDRDTAQRIVSCDYDRSNPKSPCDAAACGVDDDLQCIRYTLDYCAEFQDRGCVIQLPQLLNKKYSHEYRQIREMKSQYEN